MFTSSKGTNEETEPLWLSSGNDHIHQTRVTEPGNSSQLLDDDDEAMLFGTGALPKSYNDPPDAESNNNNSNYGSIGGKDNATSSSVASGSRASRNKKGTSVNNRKKKKQPPSSVFDDEEGGGSHDLSDDHSSVTDDDGDDDGGDYDDDDVHSKLSSLALETKPHLPNRNWCLSFFRIWSGVTVIASLGLLTTQIIPLYLGGIRSQGYFDLALKLYVAVFCLTFSVVEIDAPIPFLRNSPLLQTYLSRGFVYNFLGLICLEEAYSERVKEIVKTQGDEFHVAWASLFMQISSWLIFSCGLGYMLMGCCCLKRLKDKLREKDRKIWKRYRREMKEWKRLHT